MKYHLARGENQLGTFSDLDVSAGLRTGRFQPDDLCWTEGMKEWQPLDVRLREITPADEPSPLEPQSTPVSAPDPDGEAVLSSPQRRLLAKLIDWAMFCAPMFVMLVAMMDETFEAEIKAVQDNPAAVMEALQRRMLSLQEAGNITLTVMSWVIVLLLAVNMVLLTTRGQSVGKWLCGIRIVRAGDGGRPGFVRVVLLRWFLFAIIQSLQFIGPVLMIVDYGMVLRRDKRCLHDHVADTKVVVC